MALDKIERAQSLARDLQKFIDKNLKANAEKLTILRKSP
jgi:hypothetical protein